MKSPINKSALIRLTKLLYILAKPYTYTAVYAMVMAVTVEYFTLNIILKGLYTKDQIQDELSLLILSLAFLFAVYEFTANLRKWDIIRKRERKVCSLLKKYYWFS